MEIVRGSYRIIFVFRTFVIKFPRIFPCKAIKSIWTNALKGRVFLSKCLRRDIYGYLLGPRTFLFRGLLENSREFYFFCKYQSQFLLPTYFSLFGLLNIQKKGKKEVETDLRKILWSQMVQITEGEVWKDEHHFSNPKNFCNENGKLKIMDYGSPYAQGVLEKYADKIYEEFDLNKC